MPIFLVGTLGYSQESYSNSSVYSIVIMCDTKFILNPNKFTVDKFGGDSHFHIEKD